MVYSHVFNIPIVVFVYYNKGFIFVPNPKYKSLKKFILALLAACSMLTSTFSQPAPAPGSEDFSVAWGSEYKFPKGHIDLGFIGSIDDGFVQMSLRMGKTMIMQGFNAKLKMTKMVTVDISAMPRSFIHEGFYKVSGKYFWLYSTWDKKNKKEQLFAQEINPGAPAFAGKAIKLLDSDKIAASGFINRGWYNYQAAGKYDINTTIDSNLMMVSYRKPPEFRDDSKNKDVLGFFVFDGSLSKVWGKEVKMPYTEEKMDNMDYTLDSKGNAYLLAKVYNTTRKEKATDGKPNYHYEVLKVPNGGGSIEKIPISLSKNFIKDIYISEDFKGNLVCAGFYSQEAKSNSTDGVFITKIDDSGNFTDVYKGYYEFPSDVLKQFESARTKRKAEKREKGDDLEAANLRFRNMVINADGSIVVTGEEYYTYTTCYTSGKTTYCVTHYVYNDILAMRIGSSGNIDWVRKIPKSQHGTGGRGGMSFKLYVSNGNIFMIYLDNDKNKDIQPDEVPATHQDGAVGILTYTKINQAGEITKERLFDLREAKARLIPTDFQKVGDNMLITRTYVKGASKAVLLTEE